MLLRWAASRFESLKCFGWRLNLILTFDRVTFFVFVFIVAATKKITCEKEFVSLRLEMQSWKSLQLWRRRSDRPTTTVSTNYKALVRLLV